MAKGLKLGVSAAALALAAGVAWIARPPPMPPDGGALTRPAPPAALEMGEKHLDADLRKIELEPTAGGASEARTAAAAEAAPPSGTRFRGRVLDTRGQPIRGARVALHLHSVNGRTSEPLARGACDVSGRFTLELDAPAPEALDAHAGAPGFLESSASKVAAEQEIELRLRRAGELFGRVLDAETRASVAGARLAFGPTAFTDSESDGSYRLHGIPADVEMQLHVMHGGYVDRVLRVLIGGDGASELEVLLERGLQRVVELYDAETGFPLAGAEVRRYEGSDILSRSDASGRFTIQLAAGEEHLVRVNAEGYCPFTWYWKPESLSELVPEEAHRIPMLRLAWLEGRVTDVEGSPIDDCRVHVTCGEHYGGHPLARDERLSNRLPGSARYGRLEPSEPSRTDAGGRYRVSTIPGAEPQVVHFSHADYVSGRTEPVTLPGPGAFARVDAVLSRAGTLSGRVVCNGEPWRGSVRWQRGGQTGGTARIGFDGRYELRSVEPGTLRVFVTSLFSPQDAVREQVVRLAAGESLRLDFIWEERAVIRGRVTSAAGGPLPGEVVQAVRPGSVLCERALARTAADGSYSLSVALGGPYRVSAGLGVSQCTREGVPPGAEGVDFVLPELGTLSLRLVDAATGGPVRVTQSLSGALSWRSAGDESFRGFAGREGVDLDGVLSLSMPAGRVDLRLALGADGYLPKELRELPVASDSRADPILVALERGIQLEIHLLPSEADARLEQRARSFYLLEEEARDAVRGPLPPPAGSSNPRIDLLHVWLGAHGLRNRKLRPDEAGTAVVRALLAGRYVLFALPDELVFEPESIELRDEGRVRAELRWSAR